MSPALRVGDRIHRRIYHEAWFVLTGWTTRGKAIWRNECTGAKLQTWWSTRADLPEHYDFIEP